MRKATKLGSGKYNLTKDSLGFMELRTKYLRDYRKRMIKAISCFLALACLSASAFAGPDFDKKIDAYGRALVASANPGVFKYVETTQTMSVPLVSYIVTFSTNDAIFLSSSRRAPSNAAFTENSAKRMVWEAKFCTEKLRALMRSANVNVVNGELVNLAGKTQFIAVCTRN
jgi:hypothetical protein